MPNGEKTYILGVDDPLRLDINSYWIDNEIALEVLGNSEKFNVSYSAPVKTGLTKRQKIKISPKDDHFLDPDGLNIGPILDAFGNVITGDFTQTFEDYIKANYTDYFNLHGILSTSEDMKDVVFTNKIPIVTKDFSTSTDPATQPGIETVNEEFLINFRARSNIEKKYEDVTSDPSVSELALLNFYATNPEATSIYDPFNVSISSQVILDDAFMENYLASHLVADPAFENVIIPMDSYEELEIFGVNDHLFPLEVKISPYNSPKNNRFYDALDYSDLDLVLIDSTMIYGSHGASSILPIRERTFQVSEVPADGEIINSTENKFLLNMFEWSRDITEIVQAINPSDLNLAGEPTTGSGNKIYLGSPSLTTDSITMTYDFDGVLNITSPNVTQVATSDLEKEIAGAELSAYLEDIAEDNNRSFGEINVGKKSFSKIVFYKIEKRFDPDARLPIQTFWIPNHPDSTEAPIEYIDTQVKYNKTYFYRVFAYNAVVGTNYRYDLNSMNASFPIDTLNRAVCAITLPNDPPVSPHRHPIGNVCVDSAGNTTDCQGFVVQSNHEIDSLLVGTEDPHTHDDVTLDPASQAILDASIADGVPVGSGGKYGNSTKLYGKTGFIKPYSGFSLTGWHYHLVEVNENGIGDTICDITVSTATAATATHATNAARRGTAGGAAAAFFGGTNSSDGDEAADDQESSIGTDSDSADVAGSTAAVEEFFEIDVITEPCIDLIETHLFDFDGTILSDPPNAPDVFFIPYIGVDDKITLSMQAQIGEDKKKAVILDSTDADYIDALRSVRGLAADDLITYKTDDEVAGFEIYRTGMLPSSYDDFSNKLRNSVSTLQRSSFQYIYSWDVAYKDDITPNQVYYYMVRAVDIHGHKSYPSPVFKVQMVNDSGAVYPLIEIIEMMPPPKPQSKTKGFKKFMQLVPAIAQRAIDYEGSNLTTDGKLENSALNFANDISLGITNPKLFGTDSDPKTFKIRLISKNSGKKIDLNVTFKVKNEL
jgi:hypothetical protein